MRKKNNQLKKINYSTIILQKANKCLTGTGSDGRERVSTFSVKGKVQLYDLSKQN